MTPVVSDSFDAQWTGVFGDVNLISGSAIEVNVFDEDVADDDGVLRCQWTATPELLRSRALSCSGDVGSFLASIVAL